MGDCQHHHRGGRGGEGLAEASPSEQQKLQILLSLRLQELIAKPGGMLQSVMDETGRAAESRGLTPEILENLLRDG